MRFFRSSYVSIWLAAARLSLATWFQSSLHVWICIWETASLRWLFASENMLAWGQGNAGDAQPGLLLQLLMVSVLANAWYAYERLCIMLLNWAMVADLEGFGKFDRELWHWILSVDWLFFSVIIWLNRLFAPGIMFAWSQGGVCFW